MKDEGVGPRSGQEAFILFDAEAGHLPERTGEH
jgi:hypothetical protein